MAYRFAAAPSSGETVTLFGQVYTVEGIDAFAVTWPGAGQLTGMTCGISVGFRPGADPSQDQIIIADECDGGGEDIAILTGVDPVTFQPNLTVTTASYLVDAGDGGRDAAGVEWINDVDTGLGLDANYRSSLGVTFQVVGRDADGIVFGSNQSGFSDTDNHQDNYKGIAGCKNAKDDSATRYYYGGVDTDTGGHFAVSAFDIAAGAWASDHSIHLDGIGVPDDLAQPDRALRGLAFDGYYTYALVKQPGVDENWLYRFNGAIPDPPAGSDAAHPDASPLGAQLDSTPGLAWSSGSSRADRTGIACGRNVNIGGVWLPTFYVLADNFLYTLKPYEPPVQGHPDPGFDAPGAWCFFQFNGAGTGGVSGSQGFITHPGGGGQGGTLGPCASLSLTAGTAYTVSVDRNYTALGGSAVAELWVGTDPALSGGGDYPGTGSGTMILKDDCWAPACGSTGGFAPMPVDGGVGNPWTAPGGSVWYVLKVSGWGPGAAQTVDFDNATVEAPPKVSDWMLY
jgi:hypothetical protein